MNIFVFTFSSLCTGVAVRQFYRGSIQPAIKFVLVGLMGVDEKKVKIYSVLIVVGEKNTVVGMRHTGCDALCIQ